MIIDPEETKPLGRRGEAGGLPVFGIQNGWDVFRSPLSPSDFQQCSHHDSNHVRQKAVPMEEKAEEVSVPLKADGIHGAHAGSFHAGVAAEAPEIMGSDQLFCSALHGRKRRRTRENGHKATVEHGLGMSGVAAVAILFSGGEKPGVEAVGTAGDPVDSNVLREVAVEVCKDFRFRHGAFHVDTGSHAPGVNAGIGSACPLQSQCLRFRGLIRHACEDSLQFSLYGVVVWLMAFPSQIAGSVIADCKDVVLHGGESPFRAANSSCLFCSIT